MEVPQAAHLRRRPPLGAATRNGSPRSSSRTSSWPSPGGIKEHVRQLLAARDTPTFQREWARLEHAVKATRLPEPVALFKTLTAWRRELLTFCRTRVTNARTEAANLTAKTFKRIGRGYRNHDKSRCRIIGYAPTPIAA